MADIPIKPQTDREIMLSIWGHVSDLKNDIEELKRESKERKKGMKGWVMVVLTAVMALTGIVTIMQAKSTVDSISQASLAFYARQQPIQSAGDPQIPYARH